MQVKPLPKPKETSTEYKNNDFAVVLPGSRPPMAQPISRASMAPLPQYCGNLDSCNASQCVDQLSGPQQLRCPRVTTNDSPATSIGLSTRGSVYAEHGYGCRLANIEGKDHSCVRTGICRKILSQHQRVAERTTATTAVRDGENGAPPVSHQLRLNTACRSGDEYAVHIQHAADSTGCRSDVRCVRTIPTQQPTEQPTTTGDSTSTEQPATTGNPTSTDHQGGLAVGATTSGFLQSTSSTSFTSTATTQEGPSMSLNLYGSSNLLEKETTGVEGDGLCGTATVDWENGTINLVSGVFPEKCSSVEVVHYSPDQPEFKLTEADKAWERETIAEYERLLAAGAISPPGYVPCTFATDGWSSEAATAIRQNLGVPVKEFHCGSIAGERYCLPCDGSDDCPRTGNSNQAQPSPTRQKQ
eukprot:TRINITY_DN67891_c0_g5_i1.p1 TRINITY_DN67891_c0_g5~~TRINITY_DN67891_c0_g5_i1.p1  ORF type:complete len:414 (+),score=21.55 TRINITY_DN67891_c0_g5_i1:411-1652(+)